MASGLITSFLGEGLAASRPADPDVAGAIAFYWSTDTNEMSAWLENAWVEDVFGTGGALLVANNLSDVASAATSRTNLGLGTGDSPQFTALNIGHASDTTVTRTGAGDIAVEGNALYRAGGTDVPLADGGTGASLSDPGADRIMFWDDSAGAVTWLTPGTGLTITTTTIDASGGSSWTSLLDHDFSATPQSTASVSVVGYDEVMVEVVEAVHAASIQRALQVSTDSGSTWHGTGSNDYAEFGASGATAANAALFLHGTATTLARNGLAILHHVSDTLTPKRVTLTNRGVAAQFTASSSAITDVRLMGSSGGSGTPSGSNFTSGYFRVWGR